MNKYLYSLILVISSLLYGFSCLASSEPQQQAKQNILVLGDSLSAAYNIRTEQGWVSMLQNFLHQQGHRVNVVNASISGETTAGGLERLEQQLKQHSPKVVIIELGGNDGLRGFDLNTTQTNLQQMIELCVQYSSKVLLAGIKIPPNYGRTYTRRFEAIYTDLAKNEQVTLIPFILENVATHQQYMQNDGIHPNAAGQPLIMQTVWQYLSPMIVN